jgi:DNA-binding response OmpR family regulator
MRVLLLGSYPPLLKALRRGLEEEGHTVEVGPPRDDVAAAAADVILLDLAGPSDLVRGWRRDGVRTPVFVLGLPDAAPDAGADDWLAKPFVLDELLRRLSALGTHAREEQGTRRNGHCFGRTPR